MKLTGKAKKDFEKWFYKNIDQVGGEGLDDCSNIYLNALIIDFFDSVGIYINIENLYYQSWWYYKVKQCPDTYEQVIMQNTRQESTEEAIKKANEIYEKRV